MTVSHRHTDYGLLLIFDSEVGRVLFHFHITSGAGRAYCCSGTLMSPKEKFSKIATVSDPLRLVDCTFVIP